MKILIFGGTTEGRKLSASLARAGHDVTLSVTTEFGKYAAADNNITILTDRLDEDKIIDLLKQGKFDCVIDATHPYAVLATQNIQSACQDAGLKYFRLKRAKSAEVSGATYAADANAVAEILKKRNGKALLTIGSKELEPFTHIENFAERFFVRILPMPDSLKKVLDYGFRGSNIICMQGPFDKEMNMATLKMVGAAFLVTKDSGDAGGFDAKISAAMSLGCEVIVMARPIEEEGYRFNQLLEIFNTKKSLPQTAYFPLFVDIKNKKVLIIGGGKIAERRIKILSSFGAEIIVISPSVTQHIKFVASQGAICLLDRKYKNGDIKKLMPLFVIAATDDRQANHEAMLEAVSLNIPISVADYREECTCCFPAIAENENYIAGMVSKNGDHAGVKRMVEKIRGVLNT